GSIDLTSKVTGILPVANGGTGATTLTGLVKGSGTSALTAAVAGTDYSAGTSALGTGILKSTTSTGALTIDTASDFPTLNQSTTGNAANVTGTVAVANGGTGLTTTPTNGQIDIGNGTGFTRSTLTAGSGISITNAAGTITIASSGSGSGIPYTGATGAVDLGAYDLKVNGLSIGRGQNGSGTNNTTNTVIGYLAQQGSNGAGGGDRNTVIGSLAGRYFKDGADNTMLGYNSLASITDPFFGSSNTALGAYTLANNSYNSTTGNTAVGYNSLINTSANYNVALGWNSGGSNTTGTWNTLIGANANVGSSGLSNATAIGSGAIVSSSNTIQIGNTGVTTIGGAVAWSTSSDIRLKKDIVDTKYGLNTVMQFRPVDYTLIGNNLRQVGFIAQEMKKLVPEVVTGIEGDLSKHETLSLTYENLVAVLTKAIQEQQEIIKNLQKENSTNTEAIKKLTQQVGELFELIKK
ncbi:MAG: tail fiber domain-containing protein, partial [Chitinophagia bacterium]